MIYIFGGAFDPPHVGHSAIVRVILHYKHPTKIIIIPSSERDDKKYHVSDEHRLAMLRIFIEEIGDERVILDDHFIKNWKGEMITRDVDHYCREKYGEDIVHVFGTDTVASMPDWDEEQYAAKVVKKLFVSRKTQNQASSIKQSEGNNEYLASQFGIFNSELFTESHIPDISSTKLRQEIPLYTTLKAWYEDDPKFIIPGLSGRISRYILEHRLYRDKKTGTVTDTQMNQKRVLGIGKQKSAVSAVAVSVSSKPKVLVHVCCGPDVTMPILRLRDEYEVICFWYDPNIEPRSEYDRRFEAFQKVCEIENIPYIKGVYDVKNFHKRIRGLEHTPEKGEKCTNCYDMRMYVAAKLAKKLNIPYYTSSLNTSPKKDLNKLFRIGKDYAKRFGIEFLDIPFRKRGGFEHSVEYTRTHDIYRQNYCGCALSIHEGGRGG